MGIREEQKEKRRLEILTAGLDLFIRKGFLGTKISDIAQQVGMSVGLLFHYFESKEQLYVELIRIGISAPTDIMTSPGTDPLAFFEQTAQQVLQAIQTHPFSAKMFVLMSQAHYNEAAPESVKELLRTFDVFAPTAALIQAGQANGTIREGDPHALAAAFWCSIQGIAEQVALLPHVPCPKSEWIVDIIRRK